MSVKPDWWIQKQAEENNMISPFHPNLVSVSEQKPVVSWGLASAAYDARLGNEFITYAPRTDPLNPMMVNKSEYFTTTAETFLLRPGAFVLATTIETFIIPRNVVATVVEKSTYKRCGISMGNTRLEPGWRGQVTLEIKNGNPSRSVRLRAGEGIVAIEFHELSASEEYHEDYTILRECDVSYADRNGKYQDQVGVTLPKG